MFDFSFENPKIIVLAKAKNRDFGVANDKPNKTC